MYFESHAHYDDERFDSDREQLIEEMHKNGVDYIINAGADVESSLAGICLCDSFPFFYAAVGVHPHEAENMTKEELEKLEEYSRHKKVIAIGEIGLDYYYDFSERDKQRFWFRKQLELAEKVGLPVIIHSRDAAQECFDIIKASNIRRGVIHSYSGSVEMAQSYIEMGFYIGIGGIVTFKNAKKPIEVTEQIPIEKILIETDSPYLSPVPVRGKRNNSQNLKYICEKIGQIKQISPEKVASETMKNAFNLFFEK